MTESQGMPAGSGGLSSASGQADLAVPVSEDRDHLRGPTDAAVTLVEYGDYECPYSGAAYPIVKQIQARMGGRLRFVFRNFPVASVHPHAERAAEAAEAAGAQGKFWEMHDRLFRSQPRLGDEFLSSYAERLGLDVDRFHKELSEHTYAGRIREDLASGDRSGVPGTPTFFINGVRHGGSFDFEILLAARERAAADEG